MPRPEYMLLPAAMSEPMPATPPARRSRTSKPKVRTGCLTCKGRRVKCDERKPTCLRCEKAKVCCAGYAEVEARRKRGQSSLTTDCMAGKRFLAPRAVNAEYTADMRLPRSFVGLPQLEGHDVVYFDSFRHQVARQVMGHFTYGMWFRLAVGEAYQDECIRDCVLAIGALACSMSSPQAHGQPLSVTTTQHHQAVMRHRARAMSNLRQVRERKSLYRSPRSTMITTLLLVLLETLQGQMKEADGLMNAGMSLLRDHITFFRNSNDGGYRGVIDDDLREMEHALPCLSVMSHLSYQFQPESRVFHHLTSDPSFLFPRIGRDPISRMFANWGRFFTSALIFTGQAVYARLEGMPMHKLVMLIPRQHTFMAHLQTWKSIITDYASTPTLDDVSRKALRIVQIHWLMLRANIATALDLTEVSCDAYTEEYRSLMHLCVAFLRDELTSRTPASVLQCEGLIMPLTLIMYTCRDHDLRMEAREAVRFLPWAKDSEDGKDILLALRGKMLLEEQGRDANGHVPAEARWFAFGGEWDEDRKTSDGSFLYWRQCMGEDGSPVFTKLTVDTTSWPDVCEVAGCTKDHASFLPKSLTQRG